MTGINTIRDNIVICTIAAIHMKNKAATIKSEVANLTSSTELFNNFILFFI